MSMQLDVLHYSVEVHPDITSKHITGEVEISYQVPKDQLRFTLDKGQLEIVTVSGSNIKEYDEIDNKLLIRLHSSSTADTNKIVITYKGSPSRGLFLDGLNNHAYTIYFSQEWMVNNFEIHDKATIDLKIKVDHELECFSNGSLISVDEFEEQSVYHWSQKYETPSYTYGFVLGNFNQSTHNYRGIKIKSLGASYSEEQLTEIFKESVSIMSFLEEKSGIDYYQPVYNQILVGDYFQEMSGLSVLRDSYGLLVLDDTTETNLITHELAHQWWGNRITSSSLNHFWLNEAMATFMSAAYNEYRFGEEKYNSDIQSYFRVYELIKERGNDKPLVFNNWNNPTRDDRNLIYFKGAYFLHVLRNYIGETYFWESIKYYSQNYFDKPVSSEDFKKTFEHISGRNLDELFNEWVF
jgi:aminopeptidase N